MCAWERSFRDERTLRGRLPNGGDSVKHIDTKKETGMCKTEHSSCQCAENGKAVIRSAEFELTYRKMGSEFSGTMPVEPTVILDRSSSCEPSVKVSELSLLVPESPKALQMLSAR